MSVAPCEVEAQGQGCQYDEACPQERGVPTIGACAIQPVDGRLEGVNHVFAGVDDVLGDDGVGTLWCDH